MYAGRNLGAHLTGLSRSRTLSCPFLVWQGWDELRRRGRAGLLWRHAGFSSSCSKTTVSHLSWQKLHSLSAWSVSVVSLLSDQQDFQVPIPGLDSFHAHQSSTADNGRCWRRLSLSKQRFHHAEEVQCSRPLVKRHKTTLCYWLLWLLCRFFSSLVQRAAKLHKKKGGGSLTLLLVLPGFPATGRTKKKPDLSKYQHLSPELRGKLEAALRGRADQDSTSAREILRTEVRFKCTVPCEIEICKSKHSQKLPTWTV